MALRVYESKEQQRACFVDVVAFRDLDIAIETKVRSEERKTATYQDRGQARDIVVAQIVEEWVNPDTPKKPGVLSLPSFAARDDNDDEDGASFTDVDAEL